MMRILLTIVLLMQVMPALTQEKVYTFGVAVKPIVPSSLFRTGEVALSKGGVDYELRQRLGYSFGGLLRFGLTNWLSLESGISYVRRNFRASVFDANTNFTDTVGFRVIGYEIPVTGLVFVRLADKTFMNSAFGLTVDMFPSDVANGNTVDFYQVSRRRGWGNGASFLTWSKLALTANIGFEYRTEKSGYFYIGGSYHRPFRPIYDAYFFYTSAAGVENREQLPMSGNYLTIDFRYFFHEDKHEKAPDPSTLPAWQRK